MRLAWSRPLPRSIMSGLAAAGLGIVMTGCLCRPVMAADAMKPMVVGVWPASVLETHLALGAPPPRALVERLVETGIEVDVSVGDLREWRARRDVGGASETTKLKVAGARLLADGRTLALAIDPQPRQGVYSLGPLPSELIDGIGPNVLATHTPRGPIVHYDLSGVSATWDDGSDQAAPEWSGWWPSLDLVETQRLTVGSKAHEAGFARLGRPGRLTLVTLVQAPRSSVMVLSSGGPLEVTLGGELRSPPDPRRVVLSMPPTGELVDLAIIARTDDRASPFRLSSSLEAVAGQPDTRSLPREALLLPWAMPSPPANAAPPEPPFPLSGGNVEAGGRVFFSEQAKCANCHTVSGKGGKVGPDLTDYRKPLAEAYRAIAEPSASIRPEFTAFIVAAQGGQILSGIVRAQGPEAITVTDTDAKVTVVARKDIEDVRPSATSVMPVGLAGVVGEQGMRDLLAFLIDRPTK